MSTGFSSYWWDKEFHELPLMIYYKNDQCLDLSHSCINVVPAGLRGVKTIQLRERPIAIAPDYMGGVKYEWSAFCFHSLTDEEIKEGKKVYRKNKKFCETPHSWAGGSPHTNYKNLPNNMRFVTVGNRAFLDLRRSNVVLKHADVPVGGIKAVLLPSDRKGKASRLLKRMRNVERQRH